MIEAKKGYGDILIYNGKSSPREWPAIDFFEKPFRLNRI